jgi:hypothetical protein
MLRKEKSATETGGKLKMTMNDILKTRFNPYEKDKKSS